MLALRFFFEEQDKPAIDVWWPIGTAPHIGEHVCLKGTWYKVLERRFVDCPSEGFHIEVMAKPVEVEEWTSDSPVNVTWIAGDE